MGGFNGEVYEIVRAIPEGKVATYGQIARLMGRPKAARFVGYALHANPRPGTGPDGIPCHRVVFRDGSLPPEESFAGLAPQALLLAGEGVAFLDVADGERPRVDLAACQWDGIPFGA